MRGLRPRTLLHGGCAPAPRFTMAAPPHPASRGLRPRTSLHNGCAPAPCFTMAAPPHHASRGLRPRTLLHGGCAPALCFACGIFQKMISVRGVEENVFLRDSIVDRQK